MSEEVTADVDDKFPTSIEDRAQRKLEYESAIKRIRKEFRDEAKRLDSIPLFNSWRVYRAVRESRANAPYFDAQYIEAVAAYVNCTRLAVPPGFMLTSDLIGESTIDTFARLTVLTSERRAAGDAATRLESVGYAVFALNFSVMLFAVTEIQSLLTATLPSIWCVLSICRGW